MNTLKEILYKLSVADSLNVIESIIADFDWEKISLLEESAYDKKELEDSIKKACKNIFKFNIKLEQLPKFFLKVDILSLYFSYDDILRMVEEFDIDRYLDSFSTYENRGDEQEIINNVLTTIVNNCLENIFKGESSEYIDEMIEKIGAYPTNTNNNQKKILELFFNFLDEEELIKIFENISIDTIFYGDLLNIILQCHGDNCYLDFKRTIIKKYINYIILLEKEIDLFWAVESYFLDYSLFSYEVVNNYCLFDFIDSPILIQKLYELQSRDSLDEDSIKVYEKINSRLILSLSSKVYIDNCLKDKSSVLEIEKIISCINYEKAVFFLNELSLDEDYKKHLLATHYSCSLDDSMEVRIAKIWNWVKENTLNNNLDCDVINNISIILPDIINMPFDEYFYSSLKGKNILEYDSVYQKIYIGQLAQKRLLEFGFEKNLHLAFQEMFNSNDAIIYNDYSLILLSDDLNIDTFPTLITHEIRHYIQNRKICSSKLSYQNLTLDNLMLTMAHLIPYDDSDYMEYYQDYSEIDAYAYSFYKTYDEIEYYEVVKTLRKLSYKISKINNITLPKKNIDEMLRDFVFFKRLRESSEYFLNLLNRFIEMFGDNMVELRREFPIFRLIFSDNGELYTMEEIEEFRNNPDILLDGSIPFSDEHREDIIRYLYTFYTAYYLKLVKLFRNKELKNKCRRLIIDRKK